MSFERVQTPPLSYTRMQTHLAKKHGEQTGQSQWANRSSSPDMAPTTPSNHSIASDDDGEQRGVSNDDSFKDDTLPIHGASQPSEKPQKAASKDKAKAKTQDGQNHNIHKADAYLKDDLWHWIFIEFETFLVKVLHLPDNWHDSLESDITAIQKDEEYGTYFQAYLQLCDVVGTGIEKERELYHPHAKLCNRVIDVLHGQCTAEVGEEDLIQIFPINPYVVWGSMAMIKPGIVNVLHILFSTPEGIKAHKFIETISDKSKKSKSTRDHANRIPGWPQVLEVKEMKGTDNTIDEASDAIRLMTKDKVNVIDLESALVAETSQAGSRGQKCKAEEGNKQSSSKISRFSKTVSSKGKVESGQQKVLNEEGFAPGTDNAEKAQIQCVRYALHILSNAGLRSHALVTLIDRDRIQLSYYDRSAIIVSQAIDLANEDNEILFIMMLIGCHHLMLKQRGVLHDIIKDLYITDFCRFNKVLKDPKLLFSGLEMELQKNGENITLILGAIVYRQQGLFGCDICVIHATCTKQKGKKLVVKISWPSTSHKSEKELLDIAIAKANGMAEDGKMHWVLNHLPNILHEQDFKFNADDSVQKLIAEMVNGGHLRNGKHDAQVFVDILQCHKWLYDHPKILHRDISMANIMYQMDNEGNVLGVLIDFDLSSLILIEEAKSLHRTGTPPYMAFDLLMEEKDSGPHLYRHDLEALFYVMLMICCCHSILKRVQPSGTSQLEEISANFSMASLSARKEPAAGSWKALEDIFNLDGDDTP
ncbi:hypothetical protein IW262DRAFT_1529108 [Armillaria fumosa]|nr:hypothetical protein IW262DRAFT_1529108 [Armillaria fumosa]